MSAAQLTLRKMYAYRALDDFVLFYPFYSVYMATRSLTIFQIATLFMLWSFVDLVANVPAGVLADKYSHKNLLALGQLLKATSFVPWFAWHRRRPLTRNV